MYQKIIDFVGNVILVESFKAIKVAARNAQMSFKIATFTAQVDSCQIFKTSNLTFLLFKLGLECKYREGSNASQSKNQGHRYLRVNWGETGQRFAEANKWSMEAFLRLGLMFPPRYIRLNLSSNDILQ